MKIRRLSLRTWRGVDECEIAFDDGVTLIEGANEIGKSTLVEALRMLFREQDSSKKKEVRAIQPAGDDVGSRVEADIECGDFHFTYSKTYNRRPATELHIRAPCVEHLTGGEAHNRVRAILEAHIDMQLWDTLLVQQGQALGAIHLASSRGLAEALDTASGGQGNTGDGSLLLDAARQEYERYFTPKAGNARFSDQVDSVERLTQDVDRLRQGLRSLDDDLLTLERLENAIARLTDSLPDLQANEQTLNERWSAIDGLAEDMARAEDARAPLIALLEGAREKTLARQRQKEESDRVAARITELSAQLDPQAATLQEQQATLDALGDRLARLRQRRREQQHSERLAQADLRHITDGITLRSIDERLQRLHDLSQRADALREQCDAILIDPQGRAAIEAAHNDLVIARTLRARTATRLEIVSTRELSLQLDGSPHTLAAQERLERFLTRPLAIELPEGVHIRLTPGSGHEDPHAQVATAEAALRDLLLRYGVADLAEAMTADERRQTLTHELTQLRMQIKELLSGSDGEEELQAQARQLRQSQARWLEQRGDVAALPADRIDAERAVARAQSALTATESDIDTLEKQIEQQRVEVDRQTATHRQAAQELVVLRAQQAHRLTTLQQARERESDAALTAATVARESDLAAADERVATLRAQLAAQDPDTARALLDNARQAHRRAREDLADMRQQRAVVNSRLQLARADGQQEALAAAEQRLSAAMETLAATNRRASAARRLWERLNYFRDATQKAYVRPLQAQIERLGRIVFGPDFGLTLGDDWTIIECQRNGRALPFQDLSIGMQEQLGILTRLAAAQIVATHGGVPVIIDDALGFSDPERLRGMGAAIAAAGRDAQVILLSCTPDRFRYVGSASVVKL